MGYDRPPGAAQADFRNAREFEEEVGRHLGQFLIANLDSPDRLDYWVPGLYLDVKEKRQPLTERWMQLPGVPERELFVLDELSVRRGMQHQYGAYFLIRDVPGGNRLFLAPVHEAVGAERKRVQRKGKGKWILDLRNFRQIQDLGQILPTVLQDQVQTPWKRPYNLTQLEVPQI